MLEAVPGGALQQLPGLCIAERWCLAFVAFDLGTLHTVDRVGGHGVLFTEVFKQRGEGCQLATQGAAGELAPLEVFAPGQNVRVVNQAFAALGLEKAPRTKRL